MVQANSFNRSRIQTVIVAAINSNLDLAAAPGNVLLPARSSGLPRDSVVNVSQVLTVNRDYLTEHAGTLPTRLQGSLQPRRVSTLRPGCRFRARGLSQAVQG